MNKATVWKAIPGYPGYDVSSQGEVRSWHQRGGNYRLKEPKLMKIFTVGGYPVVSLSKLGHPNTMHITTLMRLAWFPGTDEMIVYHKNGKKDDNRLENLGIIKRAEAMNLFIARDKIYRKPIAKIDKNGIIVKLYPSVKAACADNHISKKAMTNRCRNRMVKPILMKEYTFQYINNLDDFAMPLIDREVSDA